MQLNKCFRENVPSEKVNTLLIIDATLLFSVKSVVIIYFQPRTF